MQDFDVLIKPSLNKNEMGSSSQGNCSDANIFQPIYIVGLVTQSNTQVYHTGLGESDKESDSESDFVERL